MPESGMSESATPRSSAAHAPVPDMRRSVVVAARPAEAFRIYAGYPDQWLPSGHTFIPGPAAIVIEPYVGGRFYERAADGTEMIRGMVTEWDPPSRLALTWRIGPGWQPVFDDDHASVVSAEFHPSGDDATELVLTHTHLERHGAFAEQLRYAIAAEGPDDTLQRYAAVVERHADRSGHTGA